MEEKMAHMSARFAARAGEHKTALQAAVAAGDDEAVSSQAHKLAGIAAMFGQPQVGEAAARLEEKVASEVDYRIAAERLCALLQALET